MFEMLSFSLTYLRKKRLMVIIFIISSAFGKLLSLLFPFLSGLFIDKLINSEGYTFIINFLVVYTTSYLLYVALNFLSSQLNIVLNTRIAYDLNSDIILHIQKVNKMKLDNLNMAELTQKINNDSNIIISYILNSIQSVVINIIQIIIILIILFDINVYMLIFLLMISMIYIIGYNFFKKRILKSNYLLKEAQSIYFGKLYEQLEKVNFIQIHGIVDEFINRLKFAFSNIYKTVSKYQILSNCFVAFDSGIQLLSNVFIFLLGSYFVSIGELTIGKFSTAFSYFNIIMTCYKSLFQIGQRSQEAIVSYKRLKDVLKIRKQQYGHTYIKRIHKVEIQNLNFSYETNEIFRGFNVIFEKGKAYALIGDNGSGKTTLINLLLGLYNNYYEGKILINDIPVETLDMIKLRKNNISVVEQEPSLLNDTLSFNIALNKHSNEINEEKITFLSNMMNFNDELNAHLGYYSVNNDGALNNLSGGEKQKVALIRGFSKDASLLILDEPTSALDSISKKNILRYINEIKQDNIVIIVTHDSELISICDSTIKL